MDRYLYVDILRATLFCHLFKMYNYPTGHRLMQDNDPKHTSVYGREFLEENGVNWWKTPAESPDMNPIENLWHDLKEFIQRDVKPKTKEELVQGIERFGGTATVEKYINHLKKVIPNVLERRANWLLICTKSCHTHYTCIFILYKSSIKCSSVIVRMFILLHLSSKAIAPLAQCFGTFTPCYM